jgi:tol-pal system protein YbgF
MRIWGILIAATVLSFSAVAAEQNSTIDTATRLEQIEKDMDLIKHYMYEEKQRSPEKMFKATFEELQNKLDGQLADMREEVKSLASHIEQTNYEVSKTNDKLVQASAELTHKINQLKQQISKETQIDKTLSNIDEKLDDDYLARQGGDAVALEEKEENKEVEYNQAYSDYSADELYNHAYKMVTTENFDEGQKAFEYFVAFHTQNPSVGNAYYWLGEIFYLRGQFKEAAARYLQGFKKNEGGSRAVENLLKLALSLQKIGMREEACTTVSKLMQDFPDANQNIKKRAETLREQLYCN